MKIIIPESWFFFIPNNLIHFSPNNFSFNHHKVFQISILYLHRHFQELATQRFYLFTSCRSDIVGSDHSPHSLGCPNGSQTCYTPTNHKHLGRRNFTCCCNLTCKNSPIIIQIFLHIAFHLEFCIEHKLTMAFLLFPQML